ncbi:MAG: hypothetical protein HQ515_06880 [Phycisphaeraceae bacterium]|nr:hypothetical protein [Phycisphaeraceae bacterium]
MSENLWTVNSFLNQGGELFCRYAWGWLVQSSILLAILLGLEWLLRKHTHAIFRYGLWLLILVKLILAPTLSLPSGIGYWIETPPAISTTTARIVPNQNRPHQEAMSQASAPLVAPQPARPAQAIHTVTSTAVAPVPLSFLGLMFLGWLVGVTAFLGLLITKLIFIRRLIQSGQTPADRLMSILDQARTQVNYRGSARIVLTDALPSPAVCGLFRPVILVPTELNDIANQDLKLAMMHELVHLKRGDLWVNALQSLLIMVHFYNPAAWIANVMIRQLCEEAVDETVVSLEGNIEPYSHALINISEMVSQKANIGLRLIGVMESKKAVLRRIKHMWTHPIPQRVRISAFGIIAIVSLGAILLPMVHGAQAPAPGKGSAGFHLLVLDDGDPDYKGKETYDDRLYMLDHNGQVESVITGFNRFGMSGTHAMAVDDHRKTLWVTENAGSRLWHFNLATGKLIQKIPDTRSNAVAIDPSTGNAWVIVLGGRIGEQHIKVVSPAGQIVAKHDIPGRDIAYSHYDKRFWIVGKDVYQINTQGSVTGRIIDQIAGRGLSVSIDQNNGNAWIVIDDIPNATANGPQLWIVDSDGKTIKQTIELGELIPWCVSVDSNNDNVWVGCAGVTLRFNTQGKKLKSARFASGSSVAFGPSQNQVFSADDQLIRSTYMDDGKAEIALLGPMDVLSEFRGKSIIGLPFSIAKLESSPELETIVPLTEDAIPDLDPESMSRMRKLGRALLMYANDHGDDFPDTLEQVHPYDIDAKWVTEHVTYLGKGKDTTIAPVTLLAYDKTLLKKKDYSLALFAAGHVEILRKQAFASHGVNVNGVSLE